MADLAHQIGSRIRALRQARTSARPRRGRKLTIEELAEMAEISTSYLTKLELGQHQPSAETIHKIAAALDVHPGDLFPAKSRATEKREALQDLAAFASQFTADQIRHLLAIGRVAMAPPTARARRRR